jgi:hypothetical protein
MPDLRYLGLTNMSDQSLLVSDNMIDPHYLGLENMSNPHYLCLTTLSGPSVLVLTLNIVTRPKQTTNKDRIIVHFSCQEREKRKNANNQSLAAIQP